MNKIITTDVVDPLVQQPFTADSLDFLQDANKEMIKAYALSVIGKIYDPTKYYIISGLDSYGTHQYKEGYVFHDGELYYCPGKSSTTAFSGVPVLSLTETNASFDPVIFSDNTPHSVHKIRRFVMIDASSGSGTVDYMNCIFIGRPVSFTLTGKAYNTGLVGTGTEIIGGFTFAGYNYCQYLNKGNSIDIIVKGEGFNISAGVRRIELNLPAFLNGISKVGYSVAALQVASTTDGYPLIAELASYDVISLRMIQNDTNFPTITGNTGQIYLSMNIQVT